MLTSKSDVTFNKHEPEHQNLHSMFAYELYRNKRHTPLTTYKNHNSGSFKGNLMEIIGRFEDAYQDDFKESLVSQLSRISASFQLYKDAPDSQGIENKSTGRALKIKKEHKKIKGKDDDDDGPTIKDLLKDSNECGCVGRGDCVCDSEDCECYGACEFCRGQK